MKKSNLFFEGMYPIIFASLLIAMNCCAQSAFTGTWEGKLNVGVEIRMVFNISQDASGKFVATVDSPDQGAKGIVPSSFSIAGDSIFLAIGQVNVKYEGRLTSDSTITGTLEQGVKTPLDLKKVTSISRSKRPQTPVPPFPYKSEDIVYSNKESTINYGATITIPEGKGPFPAALLLTGSGQQNRDEEIMEHKPFAVIADHLTRNGFVVLRVDDRGQGKTTGNLSSATSRDFANDAIVSLEYLMKRKEVDKKKTGLIGHSEGAMLAQLIAAERKDIDFVIMLAGPGTPTLQLMVDQNEAIINKAGFPAAQTSAYLDLYKNIVNSVLSSDTNRAIANAKTVVNEWMAKTPADIVLGTTGIQDEASKNDFVNRFVTQIDGAWFRYFLAYDPAPYIKKMTAKVLALNGSNDIQVVSKQNLAGIESALKESKSKTYEVVELPGMNHLFQECTRCDITEYGQLEQTFSPKALDIMTTWLKKVL